MCLCKECDIKLNNKGILKNDELCEKCRKIVEIVVEYETRELVAWQ